MVRPQKPGPKSRTKSKEKSQIPVTSTKKPIASLGDTYSSTGEEADDSTPATSQVSHRAEQILSNTPTNAEYTDYGLEFTTSQISTPSPRRCSTLQKHPEKAGANVTNEEASTSKKKTAKTRKVRIDANNSQTTTSPKGTTKPKESAQTGTQKSAGTRRRKQLKPQQREMHFQRLVERLQRDTNMLMPRLPFSRLVREIIMENSTETLKITRDALEALQATAEKYVTQCLQDAYLLTLHRGRITLELKDMHLISLIRAAHLGNCAL